MVDSVFGIGAPELVVILILASIVMGPQRIRQVARWLGKTTAQLQAISRGFARQLSAELDAVDSGGDIKGAMEDVQELRRQVAELRREVASTATGTVQEGKQAVEESRKILKEATQLPSLRPEEEKKEEERRIQPPTFASSDEETTKSANGEATEQPQLPNIVEVPDDPE